jgi:hypothetical protein
MKVCLGYALASSGREIEARSLFRELLVHSESHTSLLLILPSLPSD